MHDGFLDISERVKDRAWLGPALDRVGLSVIIPALNEESYIRRAIDSARQAADAEVIVVDGGSRDGTVDVARTKGATIVRSSAGRGRQMNAGAAAAKGTILLFLHADTILPPGYNRDVTRAFSRPDTSLTAFRLAIDSPRRALGWIAMAANWRARFFGMPYGDQALAVRADLFNGIGGFRDLPIMEDYEFVRACRRSGRIRLLPARVRTSARRWMNGGAIRTTMRNQLCIIGHLLGIDPVRLARWRRASGASDRSSDHGVRDVSPPGLSSPSEQAQGCLGDYHATET